MLPWFFDAIDKIDGIIGKLDSRLFRRFLAGLNPTSIFLKNDDYFVEYDELVSIKSSGTIM